MDETEDAKPRPGAGRLVLVRHGETEWSRTGQHTGTTDIPLTAAGEQQAIAVGRALHSRFDLVLTSPRQRAQRTAELAGFGGDAQVDDNLAEWDYGAYEGLTSDQIAEKTGGPWSIWRDGVPAGATPGEQGADVRRRAEAVLRRADPIVAAGGRAVVFSHSHFLHVLAVTWTGLPVADGFIFHLDTGSISSLGYEHGRHVVDGWNHVPGAQDV